MKLLHGFEVQCRVRFDGVAIEQLVELVSGQGNGMITKLRPMEAMLFQALVIQAKAIVLPEQDLDAIVTAVGEDIEFF